MAGVAFRRIGVGGSYHAQAARWTRAGSSQRDEPAGDPAGELAAPLLALADLILPPDLPPAEQVRKVSALLE